MKEKQQQQQQQHYSQFILSFFLYLFTQVCKITLKNLGFGGITKEAIVKINVLYNI